MSKVGEEAFEAVLTQGDVSPERMSQLVGVALFGKGGSDSSTDTTSSTGTTTGGDTESTSQQLKGDPFQDMAGGEYVQPRFNPDIWAAAMEQNTRLGRAIRAYARNTVGLGWYVEATHEIKPDAPAEERKLIAEETRILKRLFSRPNAQMPLTQLFYLVKIDEEATGNGYIEVVRNAKGDICNLYHIPSVTMRVRVSQDQQSREKTIGGFVQIRGNQKRYFKDFGDTRLMHAETGTFAQQVEITKRATEVLHFKVYSPTSTWYGAPRYVSASPAVAGNRLAAIRNVNFFENDAVPRMALLISGGRLAPESLQMIEDFFKNKQRGVENAHRVMIIQAEPQKVGFQQQAEAVKIQMQPMTVGVTEDASFETYRKSNDEEVREAFGISQVFFSSEQVNKSCLTGDTKVPLLDGRSLTFEELVAEYGSGQQFWVYSVDVHGHVTPGRAHSPRMTKMAEIWEVLLDNGEVVRGTDDHLFMLLDGTYRQLSSLCPGDRLKPLYRTIRPIARGEAPYWWYSTGGMEKMDAVHRMVGRFLNGGKKPVGLDIHHKRESLNNCPEYLELLTKSKHMTQSGRLRWKDWLWVKREFLGTYAGSGENHRVIRVRRTGETLPVYDLTVDTHHNFALHCGVFVHNSAQVSREITNEQEFEPDRLEKEYIINQTLVRDMLGDECSVRFRFERPKLTDPLDTARMDQTYASLGALTPNELRESIGKPRYPKDFLFGDKPLQVAMAELSMQLFEAIKGEWDQQVKHQKEVDRARQEVQQEAQQGQGGMGGFGAPGGDMGGGMGGETAMDPLLTGVDTGTAESGSAPSSTGESSSSTDTSPESTTSSDSSGKDLTSPSGSDYTRDLSINKGPGSRLWMLAEALGTARELMRDARALSRQSSNLEEEVRQ